MTATKRHIIVHAVVNNQPVDGFQLWERVTDYAADGVTVMYSSDRRIPSDQGVTWDEVQMLLANARSDEA